MHEWWDIQMLRNSTARKSPGFQERDLIRLEARCKVRSNLENVERSGLRSFKIDAKEEDRLFATYDVKSKVDATLSSIGSVSRARNGRISKMRKLAVGSDPGNRRSLKNARRLISAASHFLF